MPREIIHWRVVQGLLKTPTLARTPILYTTLNREIMSAYIGSIAHDVPYYYRAGHAPFERVADYIHGKDGEDSFEPIRRIAKQIMLSPRDQHATLWPFLFGMLSHIAADSVFHPAIFYYTGNYHDPDEKERHAAQARHRLFEVYSLAPVWQERKGLRGFSHARRVG